MIFRSFASGATAADHSGRVCDDKTLMARRRSIHDRARSSNGAPWRAPSFSFGGHSLGLLPLGNELPCQRNEFATILNRIDERIEATDQEMRNAEVVIVAEDFRDLLGRADQRGRVAVGAGELGYLGPQPFVDALALLGGREQPARAGRGVAIGRLALASQVLQRGGLLEDAFRLGPGLLLSVGDDRPH
jgi:hypothetical protein